MSNKHLELQVREPEKQRRRQQSNEPEFIEDVTHEYDKLVYVGARAQKNCSSEQSKLTKGDQNGIGNMSEQSDCTDGNRPKSLPRTFKILNCLGFLLSIAALLLVILLIAGTLPVLNCDNCNKMEHLPIGQEEEASTISSLKQENLWKVIRQVKSDLSHIKKSLKERDAKILRLQMQGLKRAGKIAELERKFTYRVYVFNGTAINVTGARSDIDLTTGKLRGENLTTCNYKREEGIQFTADEFAMGNVIVTEKKGYKILGVACSTIGASEYNLKSEINAANLRQYECECQGRSSNVKSANLAKCIIHYWICKT